MTRRISQQLITGIALLVLTLGGSSRALAADPANGEKLFKANCTSCHAINKKVIGPAMAGITQRRDEAWLIPWIKNSQAVIKSGDPYAVALFQEYNQSVMTAFPQLTDDNIRDILAYVVAEEGKTAQAAAAPGGSGDAQAGGATSPALYTGLLVLIGLLAIIIVVLLLVVALLINAVKAKEQGTTTKPADVGATFRGLLQNKFILTTAVLLIAIIATNVTIKQARSVGLHKGYAPIQPVAFSHKLHAGQYGIACQYCHIGVEKGKSAVIPSTNVCMNCHNYIQEGPRYGKGELGKIVASYESGKPIEWVKIHNLQDFVYFNHAQHVKVGGVECTTCHGPIQEMDVVYQFSDLSMGWCINCHRGEEQGDGKKYHVQTKNPYYQMTRSDLQTAGEPVKVETIGGLECAKCHY